MRYPFAGASPTASSTGRAWLMPSSTDLPQKEWLKRPLMSLMVTRATMKAQKNFKFSCPACGQRIEVDPTMSGQQTICPACQIEIIIPAAPNDPEQVPTADRALSKDEAETETTVAASPRETTTPSKSSGAKTAAQSEEHPPAAGGKGAAETGAADRSGGSGERRKQQRIAILTPEIKLDIVRSVRRRIAKETSWLPGKAEDDSNVYAAKSVDGKHVAVDAASREATHFSMMGAFMRELHRRHVVRTAHGRTKFLDQEIADAVRQVLRREGGEGGAASETDPLAERDLMSISHAECLAALDVLEAQYQRRSEEIQTSKITERVGVVRLEELIAKLEKNSPINTDDVVRALYHELNELQRRLDELEEKRK
jgi:hypothetical protein